MTTVCVDASLVVLWLLPQELSDRAIALQSLWQSQQTDLIAPPLLFAEGPSVLRSAVFHGHLSADEGDEAFGIFCGLGIRPVSRPDLHVRAWELAKELNTPRVYDMHYVALAELQRCEFYTADERLLRQIRARRPWAKGIGVS